MFIAGCLMNQNNIKKLIDIAQNFYDSSFADSATLLEFQKFPHMFVLGCVMDSQINYERAFNIPRIIARKYFNNDYSFSNYAEQNREFYIKVFQEENLHRFNFIKANAFYNAIQRIITVYNGDTTKIWSDNPSSAELVYRFLQFDGVGVKIATMMTNILARDYKIQLKDKYSIDISPDVHVKRLMFRLGFFPERENFESLSQEDIIYKARSLNPTFPGVLDLLLWTLGKDKTCTNDKCNSDKCCLSSICKKYKI